MQPAALQHDPLLQEMVDRLVKGCCPTRIYLFGSHARGEAGPDSDYDLLIVVPHSSLPFHKRAQHAFRLLCGIDAAKDVFVLNEEEFERKLPVVSSLPATAVREGRLVYAA